jgi:hypothetical protein
MIRTLFRDSPSHKWSQPEIQFVMNVCNDQRSWGPTIRPVTENETPDWIVVILSSEMIAKLYPTIGPYLSLTHHRHLLPPLTIFNLSNWYTIPEKAYQSGYRSLDFYRVYLINHEFGHMLGEDHRTCKAPGKLCPVMVQQTKGTQGCLPCVWPKMCGDIK